MSVCVRVTGPEAAPIASKARLSRSVAPSQVLAWGWGTCCRRAKHGILCLLLVWVRAACRSNPTNPSRSVLAAMQFGDAASGPGPCLTARSFEPQQAPSQI